MKTRALLAGLLLLTGCLEEKTHVTLQPDGSGSLRYEQVVGQQMSRLLQSAAKLDQRLPPEGDELGAVDGYLAGMLNEWTGVAAWTDVETGFLPDGRLRVAATGWFDDLGAVGHMTDGGGGTAYGLSRGGGRLEVQIRTAVTDEPTAKSVAEQAVAWRLMRRSVEGFRSDIVVSLPAAIDTSTGGFAPWKGDARSAALARSADWLKADGDRLVAEARRVVQRVEDGKLAQKDARAALEEASNEDAPRVAGPAGAVDEALAARAREARAGWERSPWKKKLALRKAEDDAEAAEQARAEALEALEAERNAPRLVARAPGDALSERLVVELEVGGAATFDLRVELDAAALGPDAGGDAEARGRAADRWLLEAWPDLSWARPTLEPAEGKVVLTARGYALTKTQVARVVRRGDRKDHTLVLAREWSAEGNFGRIAARAVAPAEGAPPLVLVVVPPEGLQRRAARVGFAEVDGALTVELKPGWKPELLDSAGSVRWHVEAGRSPMSREFGKAMGEAVGDWIGRSMKLQREARERERERR